MQEHGCAAVRVVAVADGECTNTFEESARVKGVVASVMLLKAGYRCS
jgi:hypothetical protein